MRILPEKPLFLRGGLGSSPIIEVLHQPVERIKTKSQKVLGPNSYLCRRGKNW